ncbi:MAG: CpsD/CapB family tyrosine-protein kinase [candidate division Zixibacteria bacterium]|nr:CpsD/CapB family tyrosine-protein kinase [candidate division Zixibacteria bacterium]
MKNKQIKSIAAYFDKESPAAIELRRLYSNILHSASSSENGFKTIAITSATLGEGKSTLASMLAITIANQMPKKVLLIDTDVRRPKIQELFNIGILNGFSDILNGTLSVKDSFKATPFENLHIITAGKIGSGATSLLDGAKLKNLFDEVKFYYDLIILDCAPIVPVSDVMDLAPEIDGVLMVVKAGYTPKEVTKRAVNLLTNSSVNIIGVIMNDVTKVLPYYYDYSYYQYQTTSDDKLPISKKQKRKT